jgi:hypothetical protein
MDRPTTKPWTSHLLLICIYVSQPRGCQEAQHAPVLCGHVRCHEECLDPADRLIGEADLATGEQMDHGGQRLLLVRGDLAHRLDDIEKRQLWGSGHRNGLLSTRGYGCRAAHHP